MCRTGKTDSPLTTLIFFAATVAATLLYAFLNGMNDSGGLVAAAISSRSLTPRIAMTLASLAEFVGPFLFGTAIATTMGKGLVEVSALSSSTLFVAIVSAIIWNLAAHYFGIPSSSTHALLGGLFGAVWIAHGIDGLIPSGFIKVFAALIAAPILGSVIGYVGMRWIKFLTRSATPDVNVFFKRVQVVNIIALALSHGTNDGQKSIGLIVLALAVAKYQTDFVAPYWAILLCAGALTLGIRFGGQRIIRTMGESIYRLRPVHAFAAQTASAAIVLGAALSGSPVSTSQVVSTAIIGVGSAERISAVRWVVTGRILAAWIITIPASALVAAMLEFIFIRFGY